MWLFLVLSLFFLSASAQDVSDSNNNDRIVSKFLTQFEDHFSFDKLTWLQEYYINDNYYKNGGPVFLMLNTKLDMGWMENGQWVEWAKEFNAVLIQLEHRYYGRNHNLFGVLTFLSSQQALADIAYFKMRIGAKYQLQKAKWILFGGGYAGSLAAWFRLKYPHLVDGAVASSAPMRAVVNFKEYYAVVSHVLANYSSTCATSISRAFGQLDDLLSNQGADGADIVTDKFSLCDPMDVSDSRSVQNFYKLIIDNIDLAVLNFGIDGTFRKDSTPELSLDQLCQIMTSDYGTELDRLASIVNNSSLTCLSHTFDATVLYLRNFKYFYSKEQMEHYQQCAEFGAFKTTDAAVQIFGNSLPISYFEEKCLVVPIGGYRFKLDAITSAVNRVNLEYGGFGIKVSNVVFTNGALDPWHPLGITTSNNQTYHAILIDGTSHCADMYPTQPHDPPQLTEARNVIKAYVEYWISSYQKTPTS